VEDGSRWEVHGRPTCTTRAAGTKAVSRWAMVGVALGGARARAHRPLRTHRGTSCTSGAAGPLDTSHDARVAAAGATHASTTPCPVPRRRGSPPERGRRPGARRLREVLFTGRLLREGGRRRGRRPAAFCQNAPKGCARQRSVPVRAARTLRSLDSACRRPARPIGAMPHLPRRPSPPCRGGSQLRARLVRHANHAVFLNWLEYGRFAALERAGSLPRDHRAGGDLRGASRGGLLRRPPRERLLVRTWRMATAHVMVLASRSSWRTIGMEIARARVTASGSSDGGRSASRGDPQRARGEIAPVKPPLRGNDIVDLQEPRTEGSTPTHASSRGSRDGERAAFARAKTRRRALAFWREELATSGVQAARAPPSSSCSFVSLADAGATVEGGSVRGARHPSCGPLGTVIHAVAVPGGPRLVLPGAIS